MITQIMEHNKVYRLKKIEAVTPEVNLLGKVIIVGVALVLVSLLIWGINEVLATRDLNLFLS